MQTDARSIKLDYDVSPLTAEFLELVFRMDIKPDPVPPRSRPSVGLDAGRIASRKVGLKLVNGMCDEPSM